MSAVVVLLSLLPVAYLLGSVPFGLIVGRARGIDVRTAGSGNIGATNVGRLLGGRYFALVFTLDLLKGLLPVLVAGLAVHGDLPGVRAAEPLAWTDFGLWLLVAFAALAGHMFSLFLGLKGGKGVATGAGVLLGVWPYFTLAAAAGIVVFLAVFAARRYISLASMVSAVSVPLAYVSLDFLLGWPARAQRWPLLVFVVVLAGLVVWKHRGNIARLRSGTEPRFARKPAT